MSGDTDRDHRRAESCMPAELTQPVLRLEDITAGYGGRPVLAGMNLRVDPAETVALLGPSGCGKTTLGRVASGLLAPDHGTVTIEGRSLAGKAGLSVPAAVRRRAQMVFQSPRRATDPRWTLREVIMRPAVAAGATTNEAEDWIRQCGLTSELLERHPSEVSDGQLQRACLARSLVLQPSLIVCDEVTAMLDAATTAAIVQVIRGEAARRGMGVLAITHDEALADAWADRVIRWGTHVIG